MVEDINIDIDSAGTAAIDGASAVAILLMLLDEDLAASILGDLGAADVKRVGSAMFQSANASEAEVAAALDKFAECTRSLPALAVEAEPRIRNVISRAVGNVRAGNILDEIAPQTSAGALDRLRWMSTEAIGQIIASEHPQVAALVLAVLTPDVAASAIGDLSPENQADLLRRAAGMGAVNAAAIADLEELLPRYEGNADAGASFKIGGKSEVAKVFNSMTKPAGERALKAMKKHDKLLGQAIEEEMFVFEDLGDLDAKALGTVLRSADSAAVTLALKGASPALAEKALASMSARAAQSIRDEMAEMPPVKRAEVEEAQRAVVAIARSMADSGEIMLGGKGDDYV